MQCSYCIFSFLISPLQMFFCLVSCSNFLALPLAVTGRQQDMDTRRRCATSKPNLHQDHEATISLASGRLWAGGTGPRGWWRGVDGLSQGWSTGDGLGAHPVPCLSYQIPLSLHSPAHKASPGPPRWCLRAGSLPAPSAEGCLLESSIPTL